MDRPGVTAAVVKKRFQVCRVYARIRLSLVHGVRIIGGVSDLIGLLTPHDAQCAFLRHALPLSLRQDVQWVMAITHQTSERAGVVPPPKALSASGCDASKACEEGHVRQDLLLLP